MRSKTNPRLWSIDCIVEWLKIRGNEGYSFPESVEEFTNELDHSALFRRLIEGKPPLPEAPPLSFNQPWYTLADKGEAEAHEVWEADAKMNDSLGFKAVIVNQHPWKILEKINDNEFVVTTGSGSKKFKLWVAGIGAADDGQAMKNWKIVNLDRKKSEAA